MMCARWRVPSINLNDWDAGTQMRTDKNYNPRLSAFTLALAGTQVPGSASN